nr:hypothetical protein GCM10020092_085860 [Actinoplanes digitatis]
MPMAERVTTSALPPAEMKGSGRPVIGSRPTTPPMLMTACATSQVVIAVATSRRNGSCTRRAIRKPVYASTANSARMTTQPTTPSSSATTA